MELTEFLLARIAEDEERARDIEHALALAQNGTLGRGGSEWLAPQWFALDAIGYTPARVLAECEAKRRVVEMADDASGLDMQVDSEFAVGPRDTDADPYLGDLILRALALPYRDHPDFDPAWAD